MEGISFSEEERKQILKRISNRIKTIEKDELQFKTDMLTVAENDEKWENQHWEAYFLTAQKRRAELLKRKGVQLAESKYNRGEIRVVLNGKTGKGKSALGNNLLWNKHFESKVSFKGITKECAFAVRNLDEEYKLLVVDTPGLFDSDTPNKEMSKEITKCVVQAAPGPHIFIFVVSIERFTQEEKDTLTNLQKLFGEKFIDHVIIVFTRKEFLEDEGLMEFMGDADDILLDLLVKCKFRFAFINNRADSDALRVDIGVILDLIFKTIGENNGAYYTNIEFGIIDDVVEKMVKEKEEKMEKEIQRLKEEERKLRDRMSLFSCIALESRIKELETRLELEKRIKELENRNVYYETKQEIEKAVKNGTFRQKPKNALGIIAEITAGAAFVAGAPVVAAGAGVAAAASWLSSWL